MCNRPSVRPLRASVAYLTPSRLGVLSGRSARAGLRERLVVPHVAGKAEDRGPPALETRAEGAKAESGRLSAFAFPSRNAGPPGQAGSGRASLGPPTSPERRWTRSAAAAVWVSPRVKGRSRVSDSAGPERARLSTCHRGSARAFPPRCCCCRGTKRARLPVAGRKRRG